MKPSVDHFSDLAQAYAKFRPDYPASLFDWLASLAPAREATLPATICA